jgi:hypothetical protein
VPKGEDLGLSLGLAAGATLCWMLSHADTGTGWWSAACGIAAWVLYTAAASWSLIRRQKTSGRLGFSYLGVAALIFSIGVALFVLGLFALGRGLGGPFGPILLVIGVGTMVLRRRGQLKRTNSPVSYQREVRAFDSPWAR